MNEIKLKTITLTDQQGKTRTYDYTVLIDELDMGSFTCESYGLRVTERERGESCTVPHITCSTSRFDELCRLVLHGQVTPVTLRDVVEDWL